ncbi:MAG TPA: hypothetical protein VN903_17630 [Polyangia bacterium]|nr:hypothetical protein [Polyangia bacterium]
MSCPICGDADCRAPHGDQIDWGTDTLALATRLATRGLQPDVWPTVHAWCHDLQRQADAKQYTLSEEERTRRENRSPLDREREAARKAVEADRRDHRPNRHRRR